MPSNAGGLSTVPGAQPRPTVIRSLNPATGALVGQVPVSTSEEVHSAVARAHAALPGWRDLGGAERAALLARAGDRVAGRVEELGDLVTAEMGKLRRGAVGEARFIAENLKSRHHLLHAIEPEEFREGSLITEVVRDPLGVVAAITPWNFPLSMPETLFSPALLAGNTVVWKPSELTPLTGALLHRLIAGALPPGVLELVQGADEVGKALVAAEVQMVAFVGSQVAGKAIMAAASRDLKRLVLELGGKDPMVVLADADLERAAEFAVRGSFRNAGQVCVSVERIYVEEAVADAFEAMVVEQARRWRVGAGTRDDVDMGPMASAEQRDHVMVQLAEARSLGARILSGGNPLPGSGHFLEPAVVVDVTDEMSLMREETFGPVAAIQRVRDAEEGIAKANAGPFGLGATLWCGDPDRARSQAARLDAGMVGVNRSIGGVSGTPWVGAKQSGFGFVDSPEGLRQFTQTRKISYEVDDA
jgi:acyl-CoA reductase-like NAD-dependent aldehyde dehydrogenase